MSFVATIVALLLVAFGSTNGAERRSFESLDYVTYPQRKSDEAAVVEWGNSAIISAIDAAVAKFGPQTSRGAFFEVETAPVLAKPLNGVGPDGLPLTKLKNHDDIVGSMAIMSNSGPLTGVRMAEIAQNSGAAAVLIVNTESGSEEVQNPEHIFSLEVEDGEEEAAEQIDIPVIMVSLNSGNLLTSAGGNGSKQSEFNMPERIRLYSAYDRPFFEDVSPEHPFVYLVHSLLTDKECDALIQNSKRKITPFDPENTNLLEGYHSPKKLKAQNIEHVHLWKGHLIKGALGKAMDERMEQVTGFPLAHMSDFSIQKFSPGSNYGLHRDTLPGTRQAIMATVTIFLNDFETGEVVYPHGDPPIKILPKKGMAIIHHNMFDDNGKQTFDYESGSAHLKFTEEGDKWIAKRYIYLDPPSPTRRILLPVLAFPFGGKLPKPIYMLHDVMVDKFGVDEGGLYFDKGLMGLVAFLVLSGAQLIGNLVTKNAKKTPKKKEKKTSTADSKKKPRGKKDKSNKSD